MDLKLGVVPRQIASKEVDFKRHRFLFFFGKCFVNELVSCITCGKHLPLHCPFFASNLVKGVHARAESPLPSRPFSCAQDHFRVSGVSLDGLKKRVAAGSLSVQKAFYLSLSIALF